MSSFPTKVHCPWMMALELSVTSFFNFSCQWHNDHWSKYHTLVLFSDTNQSAFWTKFCLPQPVIAVEYRRRSMSSTRTDSCLMWSKIRSTQLNPLTLVSSPSFFPTRINQHSAWNCNRIVDGYHNRCHVVWLPLHTSIMMIVLNRGSGANRMVSWKAL